MKTTLSPELIVIVVSAVVIAFLGGIIVGFNNAQNKNTDVAMGMKITNQMHIHEVRAVPEPYPTISLNIQPDSRAGWNVYIETTNFTFAPQNVNTEYVEGEGHAHLYINGDRLTRLYSNWYFLKELPPGQHEISVSLSGNDHSELYVRDTPIRDSQVIVVN